MNKILGVDLGTTYSCAAYIDENDKPVVLKNSDGDLTTPSVVFFESQTEVTVGASAKESAKMEPKKVVSYAKSVIGQEAVSWNVNGATYSPSDVSHYTLKKVVEDAIASLKEQNKLDQDETITDIVITCPAYFGINERDATEKAGIIAGYSVIDIINEPTAAAIAYGVADKMSEKTVMVYDLGGGTFDITIISISPERIEVVCTDGNHHLGGKQWDDALVEYFVSEWKRAKKSDEDIRTDPETNAELQDQAEKTKKLLTGKDKVPVKISHQGDSLRLDITKGIFDELTMDLLESTITITRQVLAEAEKKNISLNEISEILLVGGSCRMPQVKTCLEENFPNIEIKLFDPDEAVAKGAAIYAANRFEMMKLIEYIGETQDVSDDEAKRLFEEARKTGDTGKLGDKVIKYLKAKSVIDISNVTSRSFGIAAISSDDVERIFNIIYKNDSLPAEASEEFCTREVNQSTVEITVYESLSTESVIELSMGKEIGTATLDLPPRLPKESPLNVTFKLNESGLLEMIAEEMTKHLSVECTFDVKGSLSEQEMSKAIARSKKVNRL